MGFFLYGSGLRQRECLALRVKDVDLQYGHVIVRDGKGAKDQTTILPKAVEHLLTRKPLQPLEQAPQYIAVKDLHAS